MIGQQFGDYRVISHLGNGSYASVWLAQHVDQENSQVAIKVFHTGSGSFVNEARRLSRLEHAHIIKIIDFGLKPDGIPFIIMSHAPNNSLFMHCKGKPQQLNDVVTYMRQAADALQYAHDHEIIHLDVKPENLLLDENYQILLSDFGIAAGRATRDQAENLKDLKGGTREFMAPEQFEGTPTFASDQYALAAVAYELLSSRPAFTGASTLSEWQELHHNPPIVALSTRVPTLPPEVEQVILRALSYAPENRYERIADFAAALAQAMGIEQTRATTPSLAVSEEIFYQSMYQDAIEAEKNNDIARAFRLYQNIMIHSETANHISYIISVRNNFEALLPEFAANSIKNARTAHMQGEWDTEISIWEELQQLPLIPDDVLELFSYAKAPLKKRPRYARNNSRVPDNTHEIVVNAMKARITIALQNKHHAFLYDKARQSLHTSDKETAKQYLVLLQKNAPYYGDPAALARQTGVRNMRNYEQFLERERKLDTYLFLLNGLGTVLNFAIFYVNANSLSFFSYLLHPLHILSLSSHIALPQVSAFAIFVSSLFFLLFIVSLIIILLNILPLFNLYSLENAFLLSSFLMVLFTTTSPTLKLGLAIITLAVFIIHQKLTDHRRGKTDNSI